MLRSFIAVLLLTTTTISFAAPPILLEIDEPTTAASPGQIFLSSGWTTKNTNYTGSRGGQEVNADYNGSMFKRLRTAHMDDYATSGEGYGVPGAGTNMFLTLTLPATNTFTSASVFFLMHRQGQIADIFVDDVLVKTFDTFANSGRPYGSIAAQIQEVVISSTLAPGTHVIKIVNTGRISHSNRNESTVDGRGVQVALDCFRLGDFAFGTVRGTITDRFNQPVGHAKLSINSTVGPLLDPTGTQTLFYTDGHGRYSLSGLQRGSSYTLQVLDRAFTTSQTITIPTTGDGTLIQDFSGGKNININRPRIGIPAFVNKGSTFQIEADASDTATGWIAKLKNSYKTINLPIISSTYGATQIWNGTRPGWLITVSVPASAGHDLWNLELQATIGGSASTRTEANAVSVAESFDKSYYIGHLTDSHIKAQREMTRLVNCYSAMSVIGPQAIAMSGDLIDIHSHAQAYDAYYEMGKNCEVPLLWGPGNHDILGSDTFGQELWNRLLAQRQFAANMGPSFVLSHDNTMGTNTFCNAAWNQSFASSTDKVRMVMQHIRGSGSGDQSFEPRSPKAPHFYFFGHWHVNSASLLNTVPYIISQDTSSSYPVYGKIARFNRDGSGNWSLGTYGYPGTTSSAGIPLSTGDSAINVTRSFAGINNGSLSSNTVTIVNKTRERFEHGRARFVMEKGHYVVSSGNGQIIDQYDSDDAMKTIVQVKVDVAASATEGTSTPTAVTIFRDAGGPPPPIVVSFQDGVSGYTGTMDTYLDGIKTTTVMGAKTNIEVRLTPGTEDNRTLLRFDLSSIPVNATVSSAKLTLTCIRANGCGSGEKMTMGIVTSPWLENRTFAEGVPTTTLSTIPMADLNSYDSGTPPLPLPLVIDNGGLETVVQNWIQNPTQNYGILLTSSFTLNFGMASREIPTISQRPRLEIIYRTAAGGSAPSVAIVSPIDNGMVTNDVMVVAGTASDEGSVTGVTVNGKPASTSNGFLNWTCVITNSVGGTNTLNAIATDDSSTTSSHSTKYVYLNDTFDSNLDQIADRWQVIHFGFGFTGLPQAAANADPDADGNSNLVEFKAGTLPGDRSSNYYVTSQSIPSLNQFSVTWNSVIGKSYMPQWSDNMTNWTDGVLSPITASGPSTTWTDTDATPSKRFYRIKIP
jgi:hypothetical protein